MISEDIQSLSPTALWEGIVIDGRSIKNPDGTATFPSSLFRITNSANPKSGEWLLGGIAYSPMPMKTEGWEVSSNGMLPTPVITVANIAGILSGAAIEWNDLCGFLVTRIRTFARYLDAANWDTAPDWLEPDPAMYREDDWAISRKSHESQSIVQWELCSPWDRISQRRIPARFILSRTCPAVPYTGPECQWVAGGRGDGNLFFDGNDAPCDAAHDDCSYTINGCRIRWEGDGGPPGVTYNGFPGTQTKDISG
jgi:lambda family phage minor tail protein L